MVWVIGCPCWFHRSCSLWLAREMDPRTVSRKAMRDRVNRYMTTVFRAEPLDPTLVDYDDDLTW